MNSTENTQKKRFRLHVGMRNFKTGLSVFVILVLYHFLGRTDNFLAVTSAIICMRDTMGKSISLAVDRILGTAIGAALGIGLYYLNTVVAVKVDLTVILAALGVMLLITLCNFLGQNDAIVIGCVVFLVIILQRNQDNPLYYSVNRLVDTLVGIVVALVINRFIKNPDTRGPHGDNADNTNACAPAPPDQPPPDGAMAQENAPAPGEPAQDDAHIQEN